METLLLFLANSLTSGAVGHYVSKGLGKIDSRLPDLLNDKSNIKDACEVVAESSLESEIIRFADEVKNKIDNTNHGNILNFTGENNDGIVANTVNITTLQKNIKTNPAEGTIASSIHHRNYTKYLIDRYHDFKASEVGKQKIKYPVFYNAIKREFGAKWDNIHINKFDDLVQYLHKRIDNTVLGRNKKSKNSKRYSTFNEYLDKHS